MISNCLTYLSIPGYVKASSGPIPIGNYAQYQCVTNGWITDTGKYQKLFCSDNGSFNDTSSSWSECRPPMRCENDIPIPNENTHLGTIFK